MSRGNGRRWPAMVVATVALFAALCGGVYAAARIDGHTIKAKSLPGNRLVPRSLPANRLKPGTIPGNRLAPGSVTGAQIDAASLGRVPEATHAQEADSARRADSALVAATAIEAEKLNGHVAACGAGTRYFAGSCWETVYAADPLTAPAAAEACADRGGELPQALTLAAFAGEPGIALASGGEWSGDIPEISGLETYAVTIVLPGGEIDRSISSAEKKFRCVIPLLS